MIKLTDPEMNSLYINPDHIVSFMRNNIGSTSILTTVDTYEDSIAYRVKESPEEILKLIEAYRQNV